MGQKTFANTDPNAPEVVDRKIKALLNKPAMENFDSISDQIIQWVNRSENQTDGRTLIQVIRLVVEKTFDEAPWSEMYARLCRKVVEQINTNVHDKNAEGKPIAGGHYSASTCPTDVKKTLNADGFPKKPPLPRPRQRKAKRSRMPTNETAAVGAELDEDHRTRLASKSTDFICLLSSIKKSSLAAMSCRIDCH